MERTHETIIILLRRFYIQTLAFISRGARESIYMLYEYELCDFELRLNIFEALSLCDTTSCYRYAVCHREPN
jgi:hypothetical protein